MLAKVDITNQEQLTHTLIIGWNNEAAGLYDKLLSYPALGYAVKGFIRPAGMQENSYYKNVPVLGDITNLAKTIETNSIDEVLIVLSASEQQYLSEILSQCKKANVEFKVVADTYDTGYKHVVRDVIKDVLVPSDFGFRRLLDFDHP